MPPVNSAHSHEVMEQIKIRYTIDGDLAATLHNLVVAADLDGTLGKRIFCGHTVPKLNDFMQTIEERLDIENREEKPNE